MTGSIQVVDGDIGEPLGEVAFIAHDLLFTGEGADVDVLTGGGGADPDAALRLESTASNNHHPIARAADAEAPAVADVEGALADGGEACVGVGTEDVDALETGLG